MGAACSQPSQAQMPQDISVLIKHVSVPDHADVGLRNLQRSLSRNNLILRGRLARYTEQLRAISPSDPRAQIYISEHARTLELLKDVRRIQAALAYMA